jgi:serine/threonine protein kinase
LYSVEQDTFLACSGQEALNADERVECAYQLIEAVAFAHNKGVVHRDIKSANVLLHELQVPVEWSAQSAASKALVVKLADFGSARAISHISGLSSLGSSSSSKGGVGGTGGTSRWSPPELLTAAYHSLPSAERKLLEQAPAVDIWSLGLVFGELMTSQPPYAAAGVSAKERTIEAQVLNEEIAPFPADLLQRAGVSSPMSVLIRACTARKPEQRPTLVQIKFYFWPQVRRGIQAVGVTAGAAVAAKTSPVVFTSSAVSASSNAIAATVAGQIFGYSPHGQTSTPSSSSSQPQEVPIGFKGRAEDFLALPAHQQATVEVLKLTSCSTEVIGQIMQAVEQSKSMTTVNLSYNSIGDAGAAAVAKAIEHSKSMTTVNLRSNCIGAAGAAAVAKAIEQSKSGCVIHC